MPDYETVRKSADDVAAVTDTEPQHAEIRPETQMRALQLLAEGAPLGRFEGHGCLQR